MTGSRINVATDLLTALRNVRVAAFDVDGTLAQENSRVSERTLAALRSLADSGVRVVIATGRIAGEGRDILLRAGIGGFVSGSNGTVVLDSLGKVLSSYPLGEELFAQAREFAARMNTPLIFFTEEAMLMEYDCEARQRVGEINTGKVPLLVDFDDVDPNSVYKVIWWIPEDDGGACEAELRRVFPDAVKSLPHHMEMTRAGASKWSSIQAILDLLGCEPAQALGVGDSENDLSWLPNVGVSVAMANSVPSVISACRFSIGSNDDDAVAELIEAWLDAV